MSDKLDMDELRKKKFAKQTRWLVLAESLVILGLLIWVSIEYESNIYLQAWANANAGPISFLLNGTLAGLYAGTLLGYIIAKYAGKRTEEEEILEKLKKKSMK
jgi:F0F1-type ATP synthase membrane subunit c/vacuolar-type H+-ATPase subunit K